MLIFEGRRVPKPLQNVVQTVIRFWVTFLRVFGTILNPQMLPNCRQICPQSPPGDPQGITWGHQGAQELPRTLFLTSVASFWLIFNQILIYFGAVVDMCLAFGGCCLIYIVLPVSVCLSACLSVCLCASYASTAFRFICSGERAWDMVPVPRFLGPLLPPPPMCPPKSIKKHWS